MKRYLSTIYYTDIAYNVIGTMVVKYSIYRRMYSNKFGHLN